MLPSQGRLTELSRVVRTDPRAKEKKLSLADSPNYTPEIRKGADTLNQEGPTNGVIFPPSRRKDGKLGQVDTPAPLTGC